MKQTQPRAALLLLAVAATLQCAAPGDRPHAPSAAPASATGGEQQDTDPRARSSVPLRLSLLGTEEGDTVLLKAEATIQSAWATAPVLEVHLGDRAALLEGKRTETLRGGDRRATIVRQFRIAKGSGPVRITLDAVSEASGAHAEATYPPEPPKPAAVAPQMVPIAPLRVGGAEVRQAVPLQRATPAVSGR
jgi:hypothetical protein